MTTIKVKPQDPYWVEFSSYQTFTSVKDMIAQIKLFEKTHILTPAIKAVLNTLKLHAKRYFVGVCWLKREEIAKKAKVSLASVKRAIKALKETGILSVYPHIHTKRGGQAHNVYVINPIFKTPIEPENEPPLSELKDSVEPTATTVCADPNSSYKNFNTNSDTNLKNISSKKESTSLKNVPQEFITLMKPFYANSPDIIRARWKTVCVAVKRNCGTFRRTSWDTIGKAWKDTVRYLKRGKLKNCTDDGIGGYFYGVLSDYLMNDCWRNANIS